MRYSMLQVRNNVAYTIATIGHWDWPEQWPALFDLMMAALQDSNEFAVQVHYLVDNETKDDMTYQAGYTLYLTFISTCGEVNYLTKSFMSKVLARSKQVLLFWKFLSG